MFVINDLHLGANRTGGTTPESAAALKQYMSNMLELMLNRIDRPLIVMGDLFDSYVVPNDVLLDTYQHFKTWQKKNLDLYMVPGNHDLSKDSSKLSSFALLCKLLGVTCLRGLTNINDQIYTLSHVTNQDEFDLELARVPACEYLLVHCNYDNHFAVNSDHSLNMSKAQAEACKAEKIYFAHEHHARTMLGGKVFIGGNQFPSSVSDCLDKQSKHMYKLHEGNIMYEPTWDISNYAEIDWKFPEPTTAQFVRIGGHALPAEAAAMADFIANYRKSSNAFVVTNGVKVGEDKEVESLNLASLEALEAFSVRNALKDYLTEEENAIIESLT